MRFPTLAATVLLALPAGAARADEPVNDEFFEKKVRPILVANCVECHNAKKPKAELSLDSKAGFSAGSETGPIVKPGEWEKSLLVRVIRYDGEIKMPKKG